MSYLYVMQARDYVKVGITVNPKARLKNHATELNQEVSFLYLWHCSPDLYEKVESLACSKLLKFKAITNERFEAPVSDVVFAVLKSAEELGASLKLAHLEESMVAKPTGQSTEDYRLQVAFSKSLFSRLDKWRATQTPIPSRCAVMRQAIAWFFTHGAGSKNPEPS